MTGGSAPSPRVAVVMGSDSDYPTMKAAPDTLAEFGEPCEVRVVSAHRTPHDMLTFAAGARDRGLAVLIAGAGGAAHLPGMLASATTLPVIGVPVATTRLAGVDALLSIAQMPAGVPVATVAIDAARNAALLALRILAVDDARLAAALAAYGEELAEASRRKNDRLAQRIGEG